MNLSLSRLQEIQNKSELKILGDSKICYYVAEKDKISSMPKHSNIYSLDEIFCSFNTDVYLSENDIPVANDRVKKIIDDLNTGVKSESDLIVLKRDFSDGKYEDALHEYFVTSLFTNKLRQYIPNFAYCYGAFKLNPSKLNAPNREVSFKNNMDYVLYENINGIKMSKALSTCSKIEYITWIIQIVLSLDIAVLQFRFTHYNLHTDNILIKSISDHSQNRNKYYIPYYYMNNTWVVETKSIATIINFDMSHVKYSPVNGDVVEKGQHFGPIGYNKMGIYSNEPRPFYDLYKLLMWSLRILNKRNYKVYQECRNIAIFFGFENGDQLENALDSEEKYGYIYSVDVSDMERSTSLSDFVDLMFDLYPEMNNIMKLKDSKSLEILDCDNLHDGLCQVKTNIINTEDLTSLLSVDIVLQRYKGLKKRENELEYICPVDSNECSKIKSELTQFQNMISNDRYKIYEKEYENILKRKQDIEDQLVKRNKQLEQFRVGSKYDIPSDIIVDTYRLGDYLRKQSKSLNLKINSLKEFVDVFDLKNVNLPNNGIRVDGPFQKVMQRYSEDDVKKLVEF